MQKILTILLTIVTGFATAQAPVGAWKSQESTGSTSILIVTEHYISIASYSLLNKSFESAEGGKIEMSGDQMTYTPEFNSADTAKVGVPIVFNVSKKDGVLTLRYKDAMVWMQVDDATSAPMAGAWSITERSADGIGALVPIHRTGTRKTIKLMSGTRFQWVAIDPAVKGFYGTGGGKYIVKDGKYTEQIEFFPKDNNRVGSKLIFNWSLENGKWDHSGKSSTGQPIHEIWEKDPGL